MSRRRTAKGTTRPVIRARGPADLVAAVPYLVGFVPARSVVLVSLRGPRLRFGLVARLDLPPDGFEREAVQALCDFVRRDGPREVVALVYDDSPWQRKRRPWQQLVNSIEAELAGDDPPVPVREALYVTPERFYSYTCTFSQCCPHAGWPLTDIVASPVAAAYVFEGRAPLADRQSLSKRVAAGGPLTLAAVENVLVAEVARVAPWWLSEGAPRWAAWQRQTLSVFDEVARRYMAGGASISGDEAGRLLAGLLDITTRDVVATVWTRWWEGLTRSVPESDDPLARLVLDLAADVPPPPDLTDPAVQQGVEQLLVDLAVRSDGEAALAPLTLLAMQSWAHGNGAQAAVAVERALRLDPTYRLAGLVDTLLRSGMAPQWVASDRAHDESLPPRSPNVPLTG